MEDPWANAWGEPAKTKQPWSQPSIDAETDIAVPSWSSGAVVNWAEPSPRQETLWHPSEPAKDWASTYDDLKLASPDTPPVLDVASSSQITATAISPQSSPEPTSEYVLPAEEAELRSPSPAPRPTSPDAFGTFETGADADDPWATTSVASPDTADQGDVWVPSWGASNSEPKPSVDSESVDEWEESKRQKARQDEHVPPEVLASIVDDFHSLSNDLWPSQLPSENLPDASRGMEGVEGLNSITNRLIPHDLTLPTYVQFSKTFTAKHMGDALRSSRHVPLTRLSPFTMYMASKGSTAWEFSVKSRIELSNDDLLPPGWRVVERDKEEITPIADPKKKATGGLMSFFGRKTSSVPVESNPRRSESPANAPSISTLDAQSNTGLPSPVAAQSTRSSLDNAKPAARSSTPVLLGSLPALSSPVAPTSAPATQTPAPEVLEQPQAPSAVSRFLGRFSRTKASKPGSVESLALSTDDLEFLSDIVPSANDDADEADQLRGLTNLLSSSPSATALPPLLPAPQRLPPPNTVSEKLVMPRSAPPAANTNNDLFSIFDAPVTSMPPVPSLPPAQLAPAPLPPTLPSNTFPQSESQGLPSTSRDVGRSSSASSSRPHTPLSQRRAPIAIMSTSSASRPKSDIVLPLPPTLPPPPLSKPTNTPSHSRTPSQHNLFDGSDGFSSFHSPPISQPSLVADISTPSVFSNQSLLSDTSSLQRGINGDFLDDFDDFVSSPIHNPSPPQPPAKPSSLGQKSFTPITAEALPQSTLPPPPVKHPSPSRRADHQRTSSLVDIAAARTGKWPGPPSPLPDPLPPPDARHAVLTSNVGGFSTQWQQPAPTGNGIEPSDSAFPFLPPPPGFSGLRTTTISPSPPPHLRTASPAPSNRVMQPGRITSPAPAIAKYTPSSTPAPPGGLSAQDLSFFEGL